MNSKPPRTIDPSAPDARARVDSLLRNLSLADREDSPEYHAAAAFSRELDEWISGGRQGAPPETFTIKPPAPRVVTAPDADQEPERAKVAPRRSPAARAASVTFELDGEIWPVVIPPAPLETRELVAREISVIPGLLSRILGAPADSWPNESARIDLAHSLNALRVLGALRDKTGTPDVFVAEPWRPRPEGRVATTCAVVSGWGV